MTAISTVVLDLDDTIWRHPRSVGDRLADAFAGAGFKPFFDVTDFRRRLPEVTADSALELREKCFTAIDDEVGREPADALAVARPYEDPDPTKVQFLPSAEAALDRLAAGHDLALVTNGGRETQTAKLDALGIEHHFGALTFAGSDHAVKPDPEPFHHTLGAMDASAAETVHVGNSLRSHVAGAHAAGVGSVWLEGSTEATVDDQAPDHTIASMHDLHVPPWV
jgi:putative hydrolase of the HAD superfamily